MVSRGKIVVGKNIIFRGTTEKKTINSTFEGYKYY